MNVILIGISIAMLMLALGFASAIVFSVVVGVFNDISEKWGKKTATTIYLAVGIPILVLLTLGQTWGEINPASYNSFVGNTPVKIWPLAKGADFVINKQITIESFFFTSGYDGVNRRDAVISELPWPCQDPDRAYSGRLGTADSNEYFYDVTSLIYANIRGTEVGLQLQIDNASNLSNAGHDNVASAFIKKADRQKLMLRYISWEAAPIVVDDTAFVQVQCRVHP